MPTHRDCDLSKYDFVFSDMYFDNRCNCNELQDILSRTGDSTTIIVKLTWSTVDLSLLHSIVDEWKSYKILRTIVSGTSSEFFVVIYKKLGRSQIPSDVPVCRVVNEVWGHVNDCTVCCCDSPKRKDRDNIFKPARFDGLALLYGCGLPSPPGFFGSLFSRSAKQNMRVELRDNAKGALVPISSYDRDELISDQALLRDEDVPSNNIGERTRTHQLLDDKPISLRQAVAANYITQSAYGNLLRYAQKKGALTVGNKVDYVDNPEDGYYRVVRKKTVKLFGKEVCDVHPIDAYKRIPYMDKPDYLDLFARLTGIPLLKCRTPLMSCPTRRSSMMVMSSVKLLLRPGVGRGRRR